MLFAEHFKNEYGSELLRLGFDSSQIAKIMSALAVSMQGYTLVRQEANITIYRADDVTPKLIKLYVDCKRVENCSPAYCKNLIVFLPKLFEYAHKTPKEINAFDIRGFMATWQVDRHVSGRTMDKYRQMINNFFVWLQQEGYMENNPCSSIKRVKQETKERESLSQMELECIRASLQTNRERMLVELLYSTGCRASEVTNIKVSDLDLANGKVTLFGKGKKYRTGYLNAKAIMAIKRYLMGRTYESEYLFCNTKAPYGKVGYRSVENLIKIIGERVKGQIQHHLHPHLFRHTTATIGLNNGLPVQEIQMLLGHSSISTTMIYAKADQSQLQSDHLKCVI